MERNAVIVWQQVRIKRKRRRRCMTATGPSLSLRCKSLEVDPERTSRLQSERVF
jgi:hypothetical protein